MPTIAIDYTPAYEQGAGIGRYVRELAAALARIDQQTPYRLFVAGSSRQRLPSPPAGNFEWRSTRVSPRWFARVWHRAKVPLPVEWFTGFVNLFHATDFVLPPHLPRTKTILTVHDLSFARVPEAASPSLGAYLERVVPQSARQADYVLADSLATKQDLMELYQVADEKIEVLYGGVDQHFTRVSDAFGLMTMRSKYGIGSRPYILAVGTVQPRKNYARLIQSLAVLRSKGYDLDLVIAGGKGWLDNPIYEMIHTEGLEAYVHMIGFADENDLPGLYSDAFCLAYPSLYEGFGFPILEAMACGTPVVTANVSSMPEAAGNAALLIDPYELDTMVNAFQRLYDDTTLRTRMIELGHEQAQRFTWERSARHLLRVYEHVLENL